MQVAISLSFYPLTVQRCKKSYKRLRDIYSTIIPWLFLVASITNSKVFEACSIWWDNNH